jgi:hypothetical protein
MTQVAGFRNANVNISGNFSGQLVVGDHNVVINADHGAVVNVTAPNARPRVRSHDTPPWTPPKPPVGLLDRKSELASATADLEGIRPVELFGESGIGKTTLLRSLANQVTPSQFPDGLVYLPVRGQSVDDVRQNLFEAFCACDDRYKPSDTELHRWLREKRALVILDDLALERDDAEALLDVAPACAFAIATPQRVMWRGEVDARKLPGLPVADAVALFQHELGRVLTAEETAPVERLCIELDGHPLRVLQAAARAREDRRAIAAVAPGGQPIAPVVALSESERVVTHALAVIGPGMDRAALAATTGLPDVDAVLAQLERNRIVSREDGRYRLIIQPADGNEQATMLMMTRALAHYTEFADSLSDDPSRARAEFEPIVGTIEGAIALGWTRDALRLARLLEMPLALGARWGAWNDVLQLELHAARALSDQAAEAWALHQIGSRALCLRNFPAARHALTQALRIREALGDRAGADVTRHNLSLLPPVPAQSDRRDETPTQELPGQEQGTGTLGVGGALGGVTGLAAVAALAFWLWPRPVDIVPQVTANRTSVNFGSVRLSASADSSITLAADGTVPVDVARVTVGDSRNFALVANQCTRPLAVGATCRFSIRFTPDRAATHDATATVFDRSGRTLATIALHGSGRRSRVGIDVLPAQLDFGEAQLSSSQAESVVVESNGDAPLEISAANVVGAASGFAVDPRECRSSKLEPGRRCTIQVTFAPRGGGDHFDTLVITHNARGGPTLVPLQGVGQAISGVASPGVPELRAPANGETLTCGQSGNARQVTLEWSPPSGFDRIAGYQVRLLQTAGVQAGTAGIDITQSMPSPVWSTQLPCDGTFEWKVSAMDVAGNGSPFTASFFTIAAAAPRPAPTFRIDSFAVKPESITVGDSALLCYGVTGAARVRIDPIGQAAADAGCLDIKPQATTTYTLVAVTADSRNEERRVRIEVAARVAPLRPVGPAVELVRPAMPLAISPGARNAARPAAVFPCRVTLTWRPGPRGSATVGYLVHVDRLTPEGRAQTVLSQRVTGLTLSPASVIGEGENARWSVRAVDAAGRTSDPTPWMYFSCNVG